MTDELKLFMESEHYYTFTFIVGAMIVCIGLILVALALTIETPGIGCMGIFGVLFGIPVMIISTILYNQSISSKHQGAIETQKKPPITQTPPEPLLSEHTVVIIVVVIAIIVFLWKIRNSEKVKKDQNKRKTRNFLQLAIAQYKEETSKKNTPGRKTHKRNRP